MQSLPQDPYFNREGDAELCVKLKPYRAGPVVSKATPEVSDPAKGQGKREQLVDMVRRQDGRGVPEGVKWDFGWRGKPKMAGRDEALKTELAGQIGDGHPSLSMRSGTWSGARSVLQP